MKRILSLSRQNFLARWLLSIQYKNESKTPMIWQRLKLVWLNIVVSLVVFLHCVVTLLFTTLKNFYYYNLNSLSDVLSLITKIRVHLSYFYLIWMPKEKSSRWKISKHFEQGTSSKIHHLVINIDIVVHHAATISRMSTGVGLGREQRCCDSSHRSKTPSESFDVTLRA